MRRLAADQAKVRRSIPPNYIFPEGEDNSYLPDDLTQLAILLTGAQDTPYFNGLWRLQLRMPTDYPKSPPKATFKTRIFHPNVDPVTGAVCLEALKRDWHTKLTLRDILVTISCLLIQPNPDSALNPAAGSLLQEDYEAFAKQARLMVSVHAQIPAHMQQAVTEARHRGEEEGPRQVIRPAVPTADELSSLVKTEECSEIKAFAKNDLPRVPDIAPFQLLNFPSNVPAGRLDSVLPASMEEGNLEDRCRTDNQIQITNVLKRSATPTPDKDNQPACKMLKSEKQYEMKVAANIPCQKFPKQETPLPLLALQPRFDDKENVTRITPWQKDKIFNQYLAAQIADTPQPQLKDISGRSIARGKQGVRTGIRRL